MLVQRVLMPFTGAQSWTLLGDDGEVVEPAERYLAYLAAIERSPNTVRAYAISLKLWFEFLAQARYQPLFDNTKRLRELIGELETLSAQVVEQAEGWTSK